jgi:hypothetical protein
MASRQLEVFNSLCRQGGGEPPHSAGAVLELETLKF